MAPSAWYHGTASRLTALPERHPQCEAVIEYDDGTTEVATIPDDDVQLERPCSVFLLSEFSGYAPNKSGGAGCGSAGAGVGAGAGASKRTYKYKQKIPPLVAAAASRIRPLPAQNGAAILYRLVNAWQ